MTERDYGYKFFRLGGKAEQIALRLASDDEDVKFLPKELGPALTELGFIEKRIQVYRDEDNVIKACTRYPAIYNNPAMPGGFCVLAHENYRGEIFQPADSEEVTGSELEQLDRMTGGRPGSLMPFLITPAIDMPQETDVPGDFNPDAHILKPGPILTSQNADREPPPRAVPRENVVCYRLGGRAKEAIETLIASAEERTSLSMAETEARLKLLGQYTSVIRADAALGMVGEYPAVFRSPFFNAEPEYYLVAPVGLHRSQLNETHFIPQGSTRLDPAESQGLLAALLDGAPKVWPLFHAKPDFRLPRTPPPLPSPGPEDFG